MTCELHYLVFTALGFSGFRGRKGSLTRIHHASAPCEVNEQTFVILILC